MRSAFHPVSFDRVPLQPVEHGRADLSDSPDSNVGPQPWPSMVALPLIAGLSLALWAAIGDIVATLVAG